MAGLAPRLPVGTAKPLGRGHLSSPRGRARLPAAPAPESVPGGIMVWGHCAALWCALQTLLVEAN